MRDKIIERLNAILELLPPPTVANTDTDPPTDVDGRRSTKLYNIVFWKIDDLIDDIEDDKLTDVNPLNPHSWVELEYTMNDNGVQIVAHEMIGDSHKNTHEIVSWTNDEFLEDSEVLYVMSTAIALVIDDPDRIMDMFPDKFLFMHIDDMVDKSVPVAECGDTLMTDDPYEYEGKLYCERACVVTCMKD